MGYVIMIHHEDEEYVELAKHGETAAVASYDSLEDILSRYRFFAEAIKEATPEGRSVLVTALIVLNIKAIWLEGDSDLERMKSFCTDDRWALLEGPGYKTGPMLQIDAKYLEGMTAINISQLLLDETKK